VSGSILQIALQASRSSRETVIVGNLTGPVAWIRGSYRYPDFVDTTEFCSTGASEVWALKGTIGELCGLSTGEIMCRMGAVSSAIDKLPTPIRIVFMLLGVAACVYGFAHYGWSFILRVIFSPDL
jgi:hypothetical protein